MKSKTSNLAERPFRVNVTFARQWSAALSPSTTNETSCQSLKRKLSINSFRIGRSASLPWTSADMLGQAGPSTVELEDDVIREGGQCPLQVAPNAGFVGRSHDFPDQVAVLWNRPPNR